MNEKKWHKRLLEKIFGPKSEPVSVPDETVKESISAPVVGVPLVRTHQDKLFRQEQWKTYFRELHIKKTGWTPKSNDTEVNDEEV